MTQADSVHSTPPTNTSANNQPDPVDPTRRRFLTVAAAGAVGAAIPAADARVNPGHTADPIYAAIERHRVCAAKHEAAWNVRGQFDDCQMNDEQERQLKALEDAIELVWEPCEAAGIDLFNSAPTTAAGIIAAFRYIQIQHRSEGEHMPRGEMEAADGTDCGDWLECFLDTLIESVDALGKAVQS
jgi:hypothetical protein